MENPNLKLFYATVTACFVIGCYIIFKRWEDFPHSLVAFDSTLVFQDFVVFWSAGKLASLGQLHTLYMHSSLNAFIHSQFGDDVIGGIWVYPPQILLLLAPLSHLPPVPAFLMWIAMGYILVGYTMTQAGMTKASVISVILSGASFECIAGGQNGILASGLLFGSLVLSARKPIVAGIFLAFLSFKPQMFILAPFCIMASREYRTLIWAVGFAMILVALETAIFGIDTWRDYISIVMPNAKALYMDYQDVPFGRLGLQDMMITPFAFVRGMGGGIETAYATQAVASIGIICAAFFVFYRYKNAETNMKTAMALAIAPLVSPYAMSYDMVATAIAASILMHEGKREKLTLFFAVCVWSWPIVAYYVGVLTVPGLGAPICLGLAICAAKNIVRQHSLLAPNLDAACSSTLQPPSPQ